MSSEKTPSAVTDEREALIPSNQSERDSGDGNREREKATMAKPSSAAAPERKEAEWPKSLTSSSALQTISRCSLVLSLSLLGVTLFWVVRFGGGLGAFGLALFNWHPLLMTMAFVCLQLLGVASFRTPSLLFGESRQDRKKKHFYVFFVGVVVALLGFLAAFLFHLEKGIPHFYSVHSIMGIVALFLFGAQFLLGFRAFWQKQRIFSSLSPAQFLGTHRFLGTFSLVLSFAALISGWMDKQAILNFVGEDRASKREIDAASLAFLFVPLTIAAFGCTALVLALPRQKK